MDIDRSGVKIAGKMPSFYRSSRVNLDETIDRFDDMMTIGRRKKAIGVHPLDLITISVNTFERQRTDAIDCHVMISSISNRGQPTEDDRNVLTGPSYARRRLRLLPKSTLCQFRETIGEIIFICPPTGSFLANVSLERHRRSSFLIQEITD